MMMLAVVVIVVVGGGGRGRGEGGGRDTSVPKFSTFMAHDRLLFLLLLQVLGR